VKTENFDAVVVGTGAGGAPVAYVLAASGARVLVLEKGPRYGPHDFVRDEIVTCRRDFWVPYPEDDPHVVVEGPGARPSVSHRGWISQCVGGGTVHMSGFFFRYHPIDFELRSRAPDLTGTTLIDWPFGYEQLAPYYDRVEKELGVSGDLAQNPYDPRGDAPFPYPPVPTHPISQWIEEKGRARGYHPFHVPRAIITTPEEKLGRGACEYHQLCGSYGCENAAKSSTLATYIPLAEATGRCAVRDRCMVERVEMRNDGRAKGVVYVDARGDRRRVEADVVVVACGAIESARLLLMSRTASFPNGLGNGAGLVGRNLCLSSLGHLAGVLYYDDFGEPERRVLKNPAPFVGRAVQDLYELDPPAEGLPKAGTFHFLWAHENPIHRTERLLDARGGGLVYGSALMERLRERFGQSKTLEVESFSEWLPTDGCFVELDGEVSDRWGLPAAKIHIDQHPASVAATTRMVEASETLLADLGCRTIERIDVGGVTWVLQSGTCRMGTDPATSVTTPEGHLHEVDNLYVTDGASLPTSGGVPNTMTILANALRIAEGMAARRRA
jgi:choline dehydrogenase-like flavoprotein